MQQEAPAWSTFSRISFRIAFIYFLLFFNPFASLFVYPLAPLVSFLNSHLFHIRPELNMNGGGSGDTSFDWALVFTYGILAVGGAFVWTLLDRKRKHYSELNYWLCLILRYMLAAVSFNYGIWKVFALQMTFPSLSQLATPLGDYLPMRFSWMFIGYGGPYQIFSGVAEVLVALLLVWRRTALLGALLAVGVFANVVMLNFSYDIPVKIKSSHLLVLSLFLVWQERKRLLAFFVQNKEVLPSSVFERPFTEKWKKNLGVSLKLLFFVLYFGVQVFFSYNTFAERQASSTRVLQPVEPGIYHVELFVKNGDTIPESLANSERWRDVVFDYNGEGSMSARDTIFFMSYGRAYFGYQPDSMGKQLEIRAFRQRIANFAMDLSESDRMILNGSKGEDSLHVVLRKLDRHFPLADRQFHWISEWAQ